MWRCRTTSSLTTAPCWPPAAPEDAAELEVLRGPNIKEFPQGKPVGDAITAKLTLKVGDNITTDHIMPAGSKILPYRSNIPKLSEFCFAVCDKDVRPKRQGSRGDHFGRWKQLRTGFLKGTRGAGAPVPRCPGSHRQELRPYPRRQPHQCRYPAPDLCQPR